MEDYLSSLIDSYRAYYDVERVDQGPLRYLASFHSRSEGYVLVKRANLWSADDNEYVMFYTVDRLTEGLLEDLISKSLAHSKELIVPKKGHRSSTVTSIVLCDSVEPKCVKTVKSYRFHRSFRFTLNGWMDHRLVLLALGDGVFESSRLGKVPLKNALAVLEKVRK